MLDRFMYKLLGAVDDFFEKIDNLFTKKKRRKK